MLTTLKVFPVYKNSTLFWLGCILAQFSFLTTLNLPYQGEEGVYTITSLEMAFNQEWFIPTLYGENYARPPLFNWLILLIGSSLKWQDILIASRVVTAFATTLTSLSLIWFAQKLLQNKTLAVFIGLIYLSGDVLFRRGWLAYADPLFSLFIFNAIVCLWMSLEKNQIKWLYGAAINLIASFLTKAITGYIFYGIAAAVLYYQHSKRRFLVKVHSLILHGIVILFPLLWNKFVSKDSHVGPMVHDVFAKLTLENLSSYVGKLAWYPLETMFRWLPVSMIMLYFLIREIRQKKRFAFLEISNVKIAFWILVINYLPYWLAPQSHIRYLMPLYPLLALIIGYVAWQLGKEKVRIIFCWLIVGIVIRYLVGIFVLPNYEKSYRGNYQAIAQDILALIKDEILYVEDYSATGLSVVACLDELEMPKRVLTRPAPVWEKGFLITNTRDIPDTKISKIYQVGRHPLYLLCKGSVCR